MACYPPTQFRTRNAVTFAMMPPSRLPPFKSPGKTRSDNMRAIRSTRNATTEKRLISLFLRQRMRGWRVRPGDVPGSPDFVFPERRVAVFVDGCFFHGCPQVWTHSEDE